MYIEKNAEKVLIVTGANRGIGFETAKELAKTKSTLILACRNMIEGKKAKVTIMKSSGNKQIRVLPLDLGSFSSIQAFVTKVSEFFSRIDVLVNNAGTFVMDKSKTEDNLEMTMGVNYFGTFLLTNLLLPLLEKSADGRIINVISDAYKRGKLDIDNIEKKKTNGFKAYANSKLALAIFTLTLSNKLEGKNVFVNAVSPGHVDSGIWNFNKWYAPLIRFFSKRNMIDVAKGAEPIVYLALSENVKSKTGRYFKREKEEKIMFSNAEDQKILWDKSLKIVGLN